MKKNRLFPLCAIAVMVGTGLPSAAVFADVDPKMVDTFERVGGKFEGFRRSGAKGVCAAGEFVGSREA